MVCPSNALFAQNLPTPLPPPHLPTLLTKYTGRLKLAASLSAEDVSGLYRNVTGNNSPPGCVRELKHVHSCLNRDDKTIIIMMKDRELNAIS